MARSQTALAKRAEKRSVPIEEQRLKDSKKSRKGDADKKESVKEKKEGVKEKKPSTKQPQPIKDDNDWICTKCTNKNFHHRETCNRCQESRESQKSQVAAAEKMVVVVAPKAVAKKVETVKKPVTVASNENWTCPSCKNDNFPARTTCNRCQSEKPGSTSISTSTVSSSGAKKCATSGCAAVTIHEPKPISNRIAKGDGPISGKSLSWGKQATEKEIAENKRLLEAIGTDEANNNLSPEELARAAILKERSIRKKAKKEQRIKWKAKKLSVKAGGSKVVKVASKIQKINQMRNATVA